MTAIQNDFNKLQETKRAAMVDEAERARHNVEYEQETKRHNQVDETQKWISTIANAIFGKQGAVGSIQSGVRDTEAIAGKLIPLLLG